MLRRFDIRNENGRWRVKGLTKNTNLNNWSLGIDERRGLLLVGSTSKAKNTIFKNIAYDLEEGTLWLHNTSDEFYSSFKPKKIQDVLDQFNVLTITPIKVGRRFQIPIYEMDGKITNPVTEMKDAKFISKSVYIEGQTKKAEHMVISWVNIICLTAGAYLFQTTKKGVYLYLEENTKVEQLAELRNLGTPVDFDTVYQELAEET